MALFQQSLGPQNLDAPHQALIVGQYSRLHLDRDCTNQNVSRSTFEAAAAAEIVQARGLFVMERCEPFIPESIKRSLQFLELNLILNAGEDFLPDRTNNQLPGHPGSRQ
jgi:hypothetical protein